MTDHFLILLGRKKEYPLLVILFNIFLIKYKGERGGKKGGTKMRVYKPKNYR